MTTLRDALADEGLTVMTFNYAYTEAGKRAPDRLPKLLEVHRAAPQADQRFEDLAGPVDAQVDADNRLDAGSDRLLVELDHAEQVILVSQGHGRHVVASAAFHQLRNAHGAINERVLGVQVQMDER